MRILHVNKFLYRRGGAEAYMVDLAALQRRAGHEVEFFAMRHPENEVSRYSSAFPSQVDFDPVPEGLAAKARGAGRLLWSRSAAEGIARVIDGFAPDLVHLHNIYHQLSPSILQPIRRRKIPAVMTLHDYKLACPTYRFLDHGEICEACVPRRFWNPVIRRCNEGSVAASALSGLEMTLHTYTGAYGPVRRFICPSRFLEGKMREARVYPARLRWLPNFVDVEAFTPKAGPGGDLVCVGRLSDEKGIDVLIEAIATSPGLEANIAGDGPARGALEAQATAKGVSDRVRFLGRLGAVQVRELLARSSAAVVPSRWHENMPLSVLEAFAAGLPVIGTNLGGLPELIEPGVDGAIVAHDDVEALAEAASDMTSDPGRTFEMGRAARAKAERDFAPEPHLKGLDAIYAEARAEVGVPA